MAVTGTEDTVEATMVATEDTTTARGPLMLRLRLMPSPPPMLSPDMATTAMDMDITVMGMEVMATVATEDTTTARGLLMLSPDMVTTAVGTEATVEDTEAMVLVTATDTTVEKFQKFMLIQSD